jgi:hypothetical protein
LIFAGQQHRFLNPGNWLRQVSISPSSMRTPRIFT